jgi:hypothetical protein
MKNCFIKEKTLTTQGNQGNYELESDPPGIRTQDPILKRDVLYLLS